MHRHKVLLPLIGGLILLVAPGCLAQEFYEVIVEQAETKMRDGVVLRSDIYRPSTEGKFPVLLNRTPYEKVNELAFGLRAASQGYVVISQDVRGRYTSDGEWYPFKHEINDGYDSVEWAASLPYSNGKVGMLGGSYGGATQLLAAVSTPPHLVGLFSWVTASDYHEGWVYQGGAFQQWLNESMTTFYALDSLQRRAAVNVWLRALKLPLASYPLFGSGRQDDPTVTLPELAPYFLDWLVHPSYDDYWKRLSIEEHFSRITVPILHIGAWYDVFLGGTLRNYLGIKARGGSEAARRGQRLLVMVGGHVGPGPRIGDVGFGLDSVVNVEDLALRWYDYLLKGVKNGLESEKPVKLFVMGKNVWRDEDDWPLARARNKRFYFHSQGKANSLSGDGTLSTSPPGGEPADQYVYDPGDPAPTHGGPACCDKVHLAAGAADQRSVEARKDVLVYATPPFKEEFEVTGPVSVELFARSSAIDTDFTGKLVDVWPNGFAQNLTEGIVRARYRGSTERVEFMNPRETYKFTIDLWATSNVFLKGHRLRLEISSSNFPRFDRNLNTGEDMGRGTRWVKATNTVLHDKEHPSSLLLSVVP
jgi:putative CocE/NonD family hydrolase